MINDWTQKIFQLKDIGILRILYIIGYVIYITNAIDYKY